MPILIVLVDVVSKSAPNTLSVVLVSVFLSRACWGIELKQVLEKHELQMEQLTEYQAVVEYRCGDPSSIPDRWRWARNATYERVQRFGGEPAECSDSLVGGGRKLFYSGVDPAHPVETSVVDQNVIRGKDEFEDGYVPGNSPTPGFTFGFKFGHQQGPSRFISLRRFAQAATQIRIDEDEDKIVLRLSEFRGTDRKPVTIELSRECGWLMTKSTHVLNSGVSVVREISDFREVEPGVFFPHLSTEFFEAANGDSTSCFAKIVELSVNKRLPERLGFAFPAGIFLIVETEDGFKCTTIRKNGERYRLFDNGRDLVQDIQAAQQVQQSQLDDQKLSIPLSFWVSIIVLLSACFYLYTRRAQ